MSLGIDRVIAPLRSPPRLPEPPRQLVPIPVQPQPAATAPQPAPPAEPPASSDTPSPPPVPSEAATPPAQPANPAGATVSAAAPSQPASSISLIEAYRSERAATARPVSWIDRIDLPAAPAASGATPPPTRAEIMAQAAYGLVVDAGASDPRRALLDGG